MPTPIVALLYDFDRTLSTTDMQEYAFIPSLGMTPDAFWQKTRALAVQHRMDGILACMLMMLEETRLRGIPMTRAYLNAFGTSVQLYPGVRQWFERVNTHAAELGLKAEHYIVSAGCGEMIDGTPIAHEFKEIYASRYRFNAEGVADWPAQAINYTAKTQYIFRINKGVTDVLDEETLNRPMDASLRRVPFERMIFLGDGLTDVPAMRLTRINGGRAVAVYTGSDMAVELLRGERVDYAAPADYRAGGLLDTYIRRTLKEMAEQAHA